MLRTPGQPPYSNYSRIYPTLHNTSASPFTHNTVQQNAFLRDTVPETIRISTPHINQLPHALLLTEQVSFILCSIFPFMHRPVSLLLYSISRHRMRETTSFEIFNDTAVTSRGFSNSESTSTVHSIRRSP